MNTRTLKAIALMLIGLHFAIVVLHSMAHQILPVKATPAQLAFRSEEHTSELQSPC